MIHLEPGQAMLAAWICASASTFGVALLWSLLEDWLFPEGDG